MPRAFTRVGVLLAGCGSHDGSDPAETLLALLELERQGAHALPLALAGDQMHVVDHLSGDEMGGERRSILSEAARLTHGKVEPLGEAPLERLHALIIPGGGGAVKNLMTGYLQRGVRREPHPPVRALLAHCLAAGKPIGLMSVANFLLTGLVDTPLLPERAGTPATPLLVDEERRLVYAPAFLTARSLGQVAEAVHGLVELILHFAGSGRPAAGGGR